ncbi:PREDICTED: histone-lysine N-methyltransferase SETMAR-like [Dinoponera quadriceps]|uniref:Histone-lysine N-methyltransferase SETMAR-like n=1 Tax=Dinoponera quadriceps TaxID=609295 RepID=A0A6P3Y5K1_DINQU|nr:PREDICTED: histone-lysine N-methyltransferase SETMAR-like [Dinoponera quadriceps]
MEKNEFRAVIKHFYLRKWTAAGIKAELDDVHGESAPALKTIYFWMNEFKRGRTSTKDESRSGRPAEVTTPEMTKKIHGMVVGNGRMRKLCGRWVPRSLTGEQKRARADISRRCLARLGRDCPADFWRRLVAVDETRILYTPESKELSGPAPKKAKTVSSAGNVTATVFWDSQGVIFIDYLEKSRTVTGTYYATLLDRFDEELRTKRPRSSRKGTILQQDDAPARTSAVATAKLRELRYELLPLPFYSPDLAPCDFFLFPGLKTRLGGERFASDEEVITTVNEYFEGYDAAYYSEGIKRLEQRWAKCVELEGDYVEK